MARKPRLEFAGATYHVISRGNSRKPIFDGGSGLAIEKTLFETCEKCGWLRHAYVIMNNHYRLALETPQANLVEGMRWLQGTFGIRFNAYHRERGHVFQSRYKSLVIEEGRPLLGMVNYIHLNPVRAGLVELRSACILAFQFSQILCQMPPLWSLAVPISGRPRVSQLSLRHETPCGAPRIFRGKRPRRSR